MNEPVENFLPCDLLDDYFGGELSADRRSEFEIHLATCQSCRIAVDEWQELCRKLATAAHELERPSQGLRERIERGATARPPREGLDAQKRRVAVLLGAFLLAAALFAVVLRPAPRHDEIAKTPQAKSPTRATALSPAKLEFPDDVIGVPIDIGEPNVTVVWLYPTGQAANHAN
jgi:anti-sigma factor RsiW